MFRLWGRLVHKNHTLKDMVVCDDTSETRTHKIFRGLNSICDGKRYEGGRAYEIDAPIEKIPAFLRDGHQSELIGKI